MKADLRLALKLVAVAAIGAALPASAAVQPPQQPAQARWNVDWGAQFCTLSRSPGPGVPVTFGLRSIPGTAHRQLILLSSEWQQPPFGSGDDVTATLGTPASAFEPRVRAGRRPEHRYIVLEELGADFLDQLAAASEIRLVHGSTQVAVPLPGARGAVAALRRCEAEALREWQIDEAALARLREPPRLEQSWVGGEPYPPEDQRAGANGIVVMRLAIDERGRVSECNVVGTSGNSALDAATCRTATRRARYRPATGADGRPVPARIVSQVRWWVED